MKAGVCVWRVKEHKYFKMLQISTAFPETTSTRSACQQGSAPPTLSCWILLTGAWGEGNSVVGVGIGDPLGWGLPCCLGRLPGASFVRLGSGYECAPGLCSTLGTHHARQALPEWSHHGPHPCYAIWGPPASLESHVVFGSSFCSVKYRGQC